MKLKYVMIGNKEQGYWPVLFTDNVEHVDAMKVGKGCRSAGFCEITLEAGAGYGPNLTVATFGKSKSILAAGYIESMAEPHPEDARLIQALLTEHYSEKEVAAEERRRERR